MKDNKEYLKVYFRLNNGYEWGGGWDSERSRQFEERHGIPEPFVFKKECEHFVSQLELEDIDDRDCTIIFGSGLNYLYLHPMGFSGTLEEEKIQLIADIIENNQYQTIVLRRVEVYGDKIYKNYTEDEFEELLENHKIALEEEMLLKTTTPRKNIYVNFYLSDSFNSLSDINLIYNFRKKSGEKQLKHILRDFVERTLAGLIEDGKIIQVNGLYQNIYNVKHYRSLKK